MKQAIDLGLINIGDAVIAVQGWTGGLGHSNTLRVPIPFTTLFYPSPLPSFLDLFLISFPLSTLHLTCFIPLRSK